ncbi:hypothetical protein BLNAU_22880 [Blattamonas nauphoetae]|uniref:HAT C-terminal dimerisation domain-containing protein n=1 Tax=Blattamonas nauphoetae TaxID=2049346 RepID=A0ABQ9WRS3_9EUKA|nr:hypothetical protein BLNAU_22880 [Blattamonas nauphoetae]
MPIYLLFGSLDRKRKPSKEAFLSLLERYKSAVSLIQLPTIKSEFHSFKEMIINSPVLFPLSTHHRVAVFLQSQTNQQLYPRIFTLTKIALLVQPTSVLPERGFSQTTRTKTPFRSHLSSEALAMQSVIVANSKPSLSEEELNTLFTQYFSPCSLVSRINTSSYLGSPHPTLVAAILPIPQLFAAILPIPQLFAAILPIPQLFAAILPIPQLFAAILPIPQLFAAILPIPQLVISVPFVLTLDITFC